MGCSVGPSTYGVLGRAVYLWGARLGRLPMGPGWVVYLWGARLGRSSDGVLGRAVYLWGAGSGHPAGWCMVGSLVPSVALGVMGFGAAAVGWGAGVIGAVDGG
ncbi:hypothetical protein GCM10022226_63490 [Sphaerisporangium flaviroseum]|uniref:Uncharacterized protein n=1 Tax=Sphaerisporangium flaviroseum TaxID=509199 RepID=A0ABP7J2Y0_9ACTN